MPDIKNRYTAIAEQTLPETNNPKPIDIMNTEIKEIDGKTVITVDGRLDTVTAPEFDKTMEGHGIANDIVIDCADMEYISSAGLRSFITLLKRAKASGHILEIINLRPSIRPIFDMTGFSSIFNIG